MIIVIEGADGCGKTTIGNALGAALECDVLHFPDDNAVTGPMIRAYLKRQWVLVNATDDSTDEASGALAFQALQLANRMEHAARLRKCEGPTTKHSDYGHANIVLVRYWQSGYVYGALDGLDRDWLEAIHATLPRPDINILLDVDSSEGMRRRLERDGDAEPERYESKADTANTVAAEYRDLWNYRAGKFNGWHILDASRPAAEVGIKAYKIVRSLIGEHG